MTKKYLNDKNGAEIAFLNQHARLSLLDYKNALERNLMSLERNYATDLYNDLLDIREIVTKIEGLLIKVM